MREHTTSARAWLFMYTGSRLPVRTKYRSYLAFRGLQATRFH